MYTLTASFGLVAIMVTVVVENRKHKEGGGGGGTSTQVAANRNRCSRRRRKIFQVSKVWRVIDATASISSSCANLVALKAVNNSRGARELRGIT